MARRSGTAHQKKTGAARPPAKLYWCTTSDHDEDWFIVARSARTARRQHEIAEGYGPGDATAELVCVVPARFAPAEAGWPSDALLEACGAEFVKKDKGEGRIVRIGERVFGEGDVFANVAARMGDITRQ